MNVIREAFAGLWQETPKPTWGIKSPGCFSDIGFSDIGKIARGLADSIAVLWQEPPKRRKSPGFFSDIGKPARDILYHEYDSHLFSFTAFPILTFLGNTAITNSITDGVFGISVRHNIDGHHQASIAFIDGKSLGIGTLEVACVDVDRYSAFRTSFGLSSVDPTLGVSYSLGSRGLFLSGDVCRHMRTRVYTKYDLGLSFTHSDITLALLLREKCNALSASYHHTLLSPRATKFGWAARTTRVAAELTHRFSTAETSLTFGVRHQLDDVTSVGARVRSSGKVMALVQHLFGYWPPRARVTVSGEVDLRCIGSGAKIGLAIAMQ